MSTNAGSWWELCIVVLHYVSGTLLGCWSSSFQVWVCREKKKQEKVAKMTQALRMDLYETEVTNQGWKSSSHTFPVNLLPSHDKKGWWSILFTCRVIQNPLGHLVCDTGNDFWGCLCIAADPNLTALPSKEWRWLVLALPSPRHWVQSSSQAVDLHLIWG